MIVIKRPKDPGNLIIAGGLFLSMGYVATRLIAGPHAGLTFVAVIAIGGMTISALNSIYYLIRYGNIQGNRAKKKHIGE
jgi:hypothetical protein